MINQGKKKHSKGKYTLFLVNRLSEKIQYKPGQIYLHKIDSGKTYMVKAINHHGFDVDFPLTDESAISNIEKYWPYDESAMECNSAGWLIKRISAYLQRNMHKKLFERGVSLYNKGQHDLALNFFNEVLSIKPAHAEAWYYKSLIHEQRDNYKAAIECCDSLMKYSNKNSGAALRKERLLIISTKAQEISAIVEQGEVLLKEGKYNDAITHFDKALTIHHNHAVSLFNKGDALARQGKNDEAIEYFNKVLEINPGHINALHSKGACLARQGKNGEAIEYFNKALVINPKHVASLYNIGICLNNQKQYDSAVKYFETAEAIKPIYAADFSLDMNCFAHQKTSFENTIKHCNEALKANPKHTEALYKKGMIFMFLGRFKDALASFEQATLINPLLEKKILYVKGRALIYMGHYRKALNFFDRISEGIADYWADKALCYIMTKQLSEAEQSISKALSSEEHSIYAEQISGLYRYACGDKNGAIVVLEKVSNHYKNFTAKDDLQSQINICLSSALFFAQYNSVDNRVPNYISIGIALQPNNVHFKTLKQTASETRKSEIGSHSAPSGRPTKLLSTDSANNIPKPVFYSEPTASPFIQTSKINDSLIIPYDALEIGKKLGEGGFGAVFIGSWEHNQVAIKKLHAETMSDDVFQEFKHEATIMAELRAPNIVQLYGICVSPHYCMVMELMPKGSLYDLLQEKKPEELPWMTRLTIAKDMGAGLSYLHQRKIIHRDLKSLNVLLTNELKAKLADFGLATVKTETSSQMATTTKGAGPQGSILWMAPELFKRRPTYTPESDTYSYGIVLWEMVTHGLPFSDAANVNLVINWVQNGEREDIPGNTPEGFASLITQCWTQLPEDRPSMTEVMEQLKTINTTLFPKKSDSTHNRSSAPQLATTHSGFRGNLSSRSSKDSAEFPEKDTSSGFISSSFRGNLSLTGSTALPQTRALNTAQQRPTTSSTGFRNNLDSRSWTGSSPSFFKESRTSSLPSVDTSKPLQKESSPQPTSSDGFRGNLHSIGTRRGQRQHSSLGALASNRGRSRRAANTGSLFQQAKSTTTTNTTPTDSGFRFASNTFQ